MLVIINNGDQLAARALNVKGIAMLLDAHMCYIFSRYSVNGAGESESGVIRVLLVILLETYICTIWMLHGTNCEVSMVIVMTAKLQSWSKVCKVGAQNQSGLMVASGWFIFTLGKAQSKMFVLGDASVFAMLTLEIWPYNVCNVVSWNISFISRLRFP